MHKIKVIYQDRYVRYFMYASLLWGLVGMFVGVFIALQMAFPTLSFGSEYLTFGRLRPLHTNAVIFAFVGNMIFSGIYYSTQRLLKTGMASKRLSMIHFWGWQCIIVSAALTLPLGFSQAKEYAELEWPIDIAVAVIWLVFAVNFFWTIKKRNEKHLYVALWFYIATIVTVTILYVVNNLALPVLGSTLKSYSIFSGVQDALVQWWYGHNAVAFFLTTPVLGIMYYFLPKAAERPVYSYRLSIIHFWALVFMYIWAGPHHLLYTALPEWAQSMGMVFSLMLWAPSWGGMLNGLLTLKGAWHKLRTDPVIKFLIAGVTFYGMATFEGPLLSIKSVSALGHYTDWIIGHVHSGALGWNGFMAAGMFYWLAPKLFNTQLYSKKLADVHFWIGTVGIIFYTLSMWGSGITQGLMWRALNAEGALLYPSFVDTLIEIHWFYIMRAVGGSAYIFGFIVMAYNVYRTVQGRVPAVASIDVYVESNDELDLKSDYETKKLLTAMPVVGGMMIVVISILFFSARNESVPVALTLVMAMIAILPLIWSKAASNENRFRFHRLLEGNSFVFTVLTFVAVLIGGVVEIVPTLIIDKAVPMKGAKATPYTPLELHGRDIYVREGCYTCHSQMIRPMLAEEMRYGPTSTAGEFIYDFPFQWGSKRTGPDLHRIGGKYPDSWHFHHMIDPRAISPGSNMPSYAFLKDKKIDLDDTALKMKAMKMLGVPYDKHNISQSADLTEAQATKIIAMLSEDQIELAWDSELTALIAYLQRLGLHPEPATALNIDTYKEEN